MQRCTCIMVDSISLVDRKRTISDSESVSHLLLHCPIASDLWPFLFCLNEISWLIQNSVVLMLESWTVGVLGWGEGGMCGPPRHVWCDAFGVRERNSRIFKDRVHCAKSQAFYFWRLHEWGLKSFTLSTYPLMEYLDYTFVQLLLLYL